MKTLVAAAALVITLGLPLALAENAPTPDSKAQGANNTQPSTTGGSPNTSGDGGANNQMGQSGWHGGHRPTSPGHPDVPPPPDSLQKDSPVGTGADLQGPSKAFPANEAPE